MSTRRHGQYPGRYSTTDLHKTEEHRHSYSSPVSDSARPEPETQGEYDNRRYYDGDRDRQPLKLSGLSADLPLSESPSLKFQWNNLLAHQPDASNPAANPGLETPNFGFSSENDAYRVDSENGYGGGFAKSGASDPGADPTMKYGFFPGAFTTGVGQTHAGVPKVVDFWYGDHHTYMGPGGKTAFGSIPEFSSGLNEGFRGLSDEFDRSREMAPGPIRVAGYSKNQAPPRLSELPDSNWTQHSPTGHYTTPGLNYTVPGLNYTVPVPGLTRSENGEMGNLPVFDILHKKMENGIEGGVGEDPNSPAYWHSKSPAFSSPVYLRPSIVNGSVTEGKLKFSQGYQFHNVIDQPQPTTLNYDEVLGSSTPQSFGFGGDVGLQRCVEALSYESTLRRLALLEGHQSLDDMTTLKMCAMRKRALAKRLHGNDSNSDDLSDTSNWNDDDDFEQYPALGLSIDQAGTCREDLLNIVEDVNFEEYQLNINQNVIFEDQRIGDNVIFGDERIGEYVIFGDQRSGENVIFGDQRIQKNVTYVENEWSNDQVVRCGKDQWNVEGMNKSSELPAIPVQEHHGQQFESARVDVKKRLGPLKSPGSIKKRVVEDKLKSKSLLSQRDDVSGSIRAQVGELPKVKGKLSKKEKLPDEPQELENPAKKKLLENPAKKKLLEDLQELHKLAKKKFEESQELKKPAKKKVAEDLQELKKPAKKKVPEDLPEFKRPAKKQVPEDSQEFKKLVDTAFFKFIKDLHESTALKRNFMGGGPFTTKCCVCASNSKEFSGPVPLATHAFCSLGFRTEHLGFHKALCVLLGWDSAAVSKGTWVQRLLPDAEALALKEDYVIWPPVVVIQNTSMANKNPDKRMTVSNEQLEDILRGIGFGGGKAKVCRWKPENQSIMVVTFHATISGLREAERLHNLFSDNKHGRAEFQQISSQAALSNNSEGDQKFPADESNWLYGYLGIADDLDKLECEAKKRWFVKSKKEIQAMAIANASL